MLTLQLRLLLISSSSCLTRRGKCSVVDRVNRLYSTMSSAKDLQKAQKTRCQSTYTYTPCSCFFLCTHVSLGKNIYPQWLSNVLLFLTLEGLEFSIKKIRIITGIKLNESCKSPVVGLGIQYTFNKWYFYSQLLYSGIAFIPNAYDFSL